LKFVLNADDIKSNELSSILNPRSAILPKPGMFVGNSKSGMPPISGMNEKPPASISGRNE